jgi:methionyl-tRNA formyltransferase
VTGALAPPSSVAFLGTPAIAVPLLHAIVDTGVDVSLVVSRADARRGRRAHATPSPVKAAAQELGLAVTDDLDAVVDAQVDLAIVVAYGRIIPASLLARIPMVNVHFSLLPRWRGAAPVERAILAGDEVTGVCLMEVAEELDAGAVYSRAEVPITSSTTAADLRDRLVDASIPLLRDALRAGFGVPEPQEGEAVYADKITSDDLYLDWERPAVELDRIVRVGGAWTTLAGKRFKVWESSVIADDPDGAGHPGELWGTRVTCGRGALDLREVQVEGKGRADAAAWRTGARVDDGVVLGG